jgi:hypothetical protein
VYCGSEEHGYSEGVFASDWFFSDDFEEPDGYNQSSRLSISCFQFDVSSITSASLVIDGSSRFVNTWSVIGSDVLRMTEDRLQSMILWHSLIGIESEPFMATSPFTLSLELLESALFSADNVSSTLSRSSPGFIVGGCAAFLALLIVSITVFLHHRRNETPVRGYDGEFEVNHSVKFLMKVKSQQPMILFSPMPLTQWKVLASRLKHLMKVSSAVLCLWSV